MELLVLPGFQHTGTGFSREPSVLYLGRTHQCPGQYKARTNSGCHSCFIPKTPDMLGAPLLSYFRFRSLEVLVHPASDGRGKSIDRSGVSSISARVSKDRDLFAAGERLSRGRIQPSSSLTHPPHCRRQEFSQPIGKSARTPTPVQNAQTVNSVDVRSSESRLYIELAVMDGLFNGQAFPVQNWGTIGCVLQHFLGCGGDDALSRG